jgi:hypothetical protein
VFDVELDRLDIGIIHRNIPIVPGGRAASHRRGGTLIMVDDDRYSTTAKAMIRRCDSALSAAIR